MVAWEPERRRFRAHLTVARVRGREPLLAAPGGADRTSRPPPPCASSPQSLTLYRSWLEPGGARYEALATRPLAHAC